MAWGGVVCCAMAWHGVAWCVTPASGAHVCGVRGGAGAGAVTKDKGPVERGGVEVQSWQCIPSQLLNELCQREKRPRPMYFAKGWCGLRRPAAPEVLFF